MTNDKEWYPEVKVGEEFRREDGVPVRKVGPDFQEEAQRQLDTAFTGLKIVRNPEDGHFEVDNKEEFIRQIKLRHPDIK